MAQITQNVPNQSLQVPEYLREVPSFSGFMDSRGNRSGMFGQQALGSAIQDTASTLDTGIKTYLKEDLSNQIDKVRQDFGINQASDIAATGQPPTQAKGDSTSLASQLGSPSLTGQGVTGAPGTGGSAGINGAKPGQIKGSPPGVAKLGTTMDSLTTAYNSGRLSESYYWARMESIVRQMRSNFPGYRDEIDQYVSQKLGTTPANALRRSLLFDLDQQERAKYANANSNQSWINQNDKYIVQVQPDFFKNPNSMPFGELRARVAMLKANEEQTKAARERIGLSADINKDQGVKAEGLLSRELYQSLDTTLNGAGTVAGLTGLGGLPDNIQQKIQKQEPLAADDQRVVGNYFNALRTKVFNDFDGIINKADSTGGTYASYINNPNRIQEIKKLAASKLDTLEQSLYNGHNGIVLANDAYVKARQSDVAALVSQKWPEGDIIQHLNKVLGPQGFNFLMINDGGKIMQDTVGAYRLFGIGNATDPNHVNSSLSDDAREIKARTGLDPDAKLPASYSIGTLRDHIGMLTNDLIPDNIRQQVAKKLFTNDQNGRYLQNYPVNQRLGVYQRLASPDITRAVQKIAEKNPQIWNDYVTWAKQNFAGVYHSVSSDIQSFQSNPVVDLQFDGDSNHFRFQANRSPDAMRRANMSLLGREQYVQHANQAMDRFNSALDVLTPILKANHENVPQTLQSLLAHEVGVTTQVQKNGPPPGERLIQSLREWVGSEDVNAAAIKKAIPQK